MCSETDKKLEAKLRANWNTCICNECKEGRSQIIAKHRQQVCAECPILISGMEACGKCERSETIRRFEACFVRIAKAVGLVTPLELIAKAENNEENYAEILARHIEQTCGAERDKEDAKQDIMDLLFEYESGLDCSGMDSEATYFLAWRELLKCDKITVEDVLIRVRDRYADNNADIVAKFEAVAGKGEG